MLESALANLQWSKQFEAQASDIISRHLASKIMRFVTSSQQQDMEESTDMVPYVDTNSGRIALRFRRRHIGYRDLTIRSWCASGMRTERDKIQSGWGRWYMYGWTNDTVICEWVIIDIKVLRASGIMLARPTTMNHDGLTGFIQLDIKELEDIGAVVAKCLVVRAVELPSVCELCSSQESPGLLSWQGAVYSCVRCCIAAQESEDAQILLRGAARAEWMVDRYKQETREWRKRLGFKPED